MPPRPFPSPLHIGTDIVHVKRIHDILLRAEGQPQHRRRFLRRFLTPGEEREFQLRFGDVAEDYGTRLSLVSKHLAGRWAAKEAAIKAVTWRRLSFHHVIIQQARGHSHLHALIMDDDSATTAKLEASGGRSALQEESGTCSDPSSTPEVDGQIARISISHDGDYATAVCLAAEDP